ncbi:MAG: metallophosphoesterase [Nocardioidaceae bacterium]
MRRILLLLAAWLVVAVPASLVILTHSSDTTTIAGHEVVVTPTLDGWASFDMGPYLPDFRAPSGSRLGAHVDVGKTTASDYDTLIDRYVSIAASPTSQIAKLRHTIVQLTIRAGVAGAMIGLAGPLALLLIGRERWHALANAASVRRTLIIATCSALVVVGTVIAIEPGTGDESVETRQWQPLADAVPNVSIPAEARGVEIDRNLITVGTSRLVQSLVSSYRSSLDFYRELAKKADKIGSQLHRPGEGETVALLVADRHDNTPMDPVARAVYDQGHASFLLDAGDDTSTGSKWEGFSLESLAHEFDDTSGRYSVSGNHDNGNYVTDKMKSLGFTPLVGKPVDGPDGIRLLGVSDPRSSGLGSWIDAKQLTLAEQTEKLGDLACAEDAAGRRISTMLVHDVDTGADALSRGCVDLVLAGHRHEQIGPTRVVGSNGSVGYSFVNGTTGGAAYAIALGSKLRRNAQVSLVTYRDGRPVGIQPVTFRTVGDIVVEPYQSLEQP